MTGKVRSVAVKQLIMDVGKILDNFLTYPFSADEVRRLVDIIRLMRARWSGDMQSFTPAKDFKLPSQDNHTQSKMLLAEEKWVEYSNRISRLGEEADRGMSSLRHLAQGRLDISVVEDYLQLLRNDHPRFPIANTQTFDSSTISAFIDSIKEKPIIQPFRDGEHWLFAAVYPDIIPWYDSKPDAASPFSLRSSAGPKDNDRQHDNSAFFMLLGIRLTANAHAHLSQQEAEMVISNFRSRMLVELLTGSLRPKREDFAVLDHKERRERAARLHRENEQNSAYFNEAIDGMDFPPWRQESSTPSSAGTPNPSPSAAITDTHSPLDDRNTILMTLCNAVASIRSITASESTDLAVLWSSLNDGARVSEFHKRYNGILFCDKLEKCGMIDARWLESNHNIARSSFHAVRKAQERYRLWRDLCKLHDDQGSAKYTLLCVIPEGQPMDRQQISTIGLRLVDSTDPLTDQVRKATDLCKAIVESRLPSHHLLIERYKSKAHEPLTPEMYDAFLSLQPRPRVAIPRMFPPQQR
jgi:hypothetical protein